MNAIHKKEVLVKNNCLLSFDTTRTVQKKTRPIILLLRMYSLPRLMGETYEDAVKMGPTAMIYIPSFIKIA
jgi:hypothetical protein